jgi:L-lactate dehydrogenase complex protein LldG
MSDARTTILGRIERALRTARIPAVPPVAATPDLQPPPSLQGGEREPQRPTRDPGALLERFLAEARALGVEAFVERSAAAVRERLATIVSGRRVLSWDPEQLPYGAAAVVAAALRGSAPLAEQALADIGVTSCHGAIAETGSLALLSGAGASRTVSLLPPVHVALVQPSDLVLTMGEFFATNSVRMAGASSCTFVTGPSRTADIELSLTIGVHGPGRVVVIVGP